ncbi:MAG: alanine racemase [Bryobacteraceae bacterium]|nr:alanine racemase [Bryobacteraceae bacterium]
MRVEELDTPALIVDLDIMERNLKRVQDYASEHNLRLRPHTKTHKIPALGRRQLDLGAVGLTVAKTTEAEVMLQAKPKDLLIAYPVFGAWKLRRLAALAKQTKVTVALDGVESVQALAEAADQLDFHIGVLIEFDAGLHRVGVTPDGALATLTRAVSQSSRLEFRGLTFYPGQIKDVRNGGAAAMADLDRIVEKAVATVEAVGLFPDIVSGGSTPTLFASHHVTRLTEIRPGTYIFNDRNTWLMGACKLEDCAAFVLTTVVSTAVPNQMILDGGSKTFSSDRPVFPDAEGFGYLPDAPGAKFTKMNEEHGFVQTGDYAGKWKVGDTVRVMPNHICVAVNLHEKVYGVRGEEVEEIWQVEGRGRLQ